MFGPRTILEQPRELDKEPGLSVLVRVGSRDNSARLRRARGQMTAGPGRRRQCALVDEPERCRSSVRPLLDERALVGEIELRDTP